MKKKIPLIIAIIVLLVQSMVGPLVAVAESLETQEPIVELTHLTGDLVDLDDQPITQLNPVKQGDSYRVQLVGTLKKASELAESLSLVISSNLIVNGASSAITDNANEVIGEATIAGQTANLAFLADVTGERTFKVSIPVSYKSAEVLAEDTLTLTSVLGAFEHPFPIYQEPVTTEPTITEEVVEKKDVKKRRQIPAIAEPNGLEANSLNGFINKKEITKNIITDVDWQVHPNATQQPTIESTFKIGYKWELPESLRKSMVGGETFKFNLPPELIINSPQSGHLENKNGPDFGTFTISTSGEVEITFNENVSDRSQISGTLWVVSQLNKKIITSPHEVVINTPIKGDDQIITIPISSLAEQTLSKTGKFDKDDNPSVVIWNVYVNKAKETLTDIKVVDNLPKGLVLEGKEHVKVYEVAVDHYGEVGPDIAVLEATEYSMSGTTVLISGTSNKSYRVEYTTKIEESAKPDNGGEVSFENHATQSSQGVKKLDTDATVTAVYKEMLTKKMIDYNAGEQRFDWKVAFNYGEKKIVEADAFLTDTFSENLELVKESVALMNQTAGTPLILGTDYEISQVGNSFTIQFKSDINYKVEAVYSTKVKDGYVIDDGAHEVKNKVVSFGKNEDSDKGQARQTGLLKWVDVDHTSQTADWLIQVNRDKYQMTDWRMTDTFTNKGLTLDVTSLEVRANSRNGDKLKLGTDYKLTVKDPKVGYTLEFLGDYQSTDEIFYISYKTRYDKNELLAGEQTFRNHAVGTWFDQAGETRTNTADSWFDTSPETYTNGSKSGSYNAVSKKITWTVNVNYQRDEILKGAIVDQIKGNQKYVAGSAQLATYKVLKAGDMELVEVLPDVTVTEPSKENQQTLTALLPEKSERLVYQLTFETSLANEVIGASKEYDNQAIFTVAGKTQDTLIASVPIKHGGSFASKSGHYDRHKPEELAWSIKVNESQSTIKGFEVIDQPSANQLIKAETLKVTEMTATEEGDLTPSSTILTLDEDYRVDFDTDLETGQEKMVITFLREISKAYEITYLSQLLLNDGDNAVTNSVSVKGDNEKISVENVSETVDVYHVDSGGTSTGKVTEFYLKKENDRGQQLAGVTFNLLNGKTRNVIRSGTTDENGLIHFKNVLSGTYYLQEVEHLAGYMVSDHLLNGLQKVEIEAGDYPKDKPLVMVNTLNEVELFKVDANGKGIAGADFALTKKDDSGVYQGVLGYHALRSEGETGRIFIEGLDKGEYRLIETAAASGYIKNITPIDFTITGSEEQRKALGQFTNYQGVAQLQKTDANGQGLSGAVFNLYDEKLNIVQEKITSNKDGLVEFAKLAPGKYSIVEVEAPAGYLLNQKVTQFEVTHESAGKPTPMVVGSIINYQGSATFTKKDVNGNGLPGAIFKVTSESGQVIQENIISNKDGEVLVKDLAPGIYYIEETKAPEKHIVNSRKIKITIPSENEGAPRVVLADELINYQSEAKLRKEDSEGKGLAGATFKVIDSDKQTVVENLISNDEGIVTVSGLSAGDYAFVETAAPTGFMLNPTPKTFTIEASYEDQPELENAGRLVNYQGSVELTKVDENQKRLVGANFSLYDQADKEVKTDLSTNDNGQIKVNNLAPGTYYFQETKAPADYILNNERLTFTITANATEEQEEVVVTAINHKGTATLLKM